MTMTSGCTGADWSRNANTANSCANDTYACLNANTSYYASTQRWQLATQHVLHFPPELNIDRITIVDDEDMHEQAHISYTAYL